MKVIYGLSAIMIFLILACTSKLFEPQEVIEPKYKAVELDSLETIEYQGYLVGVWSSKGIMTVRGKNKDHPVNYLFLVGRSACGFIYPYQIGVCVSVVSTTKHYKDSTLATPLSSYSDYIFETDTDYTDQYLERSTQGKHPLIATDRIRRNFKDVTIDTGTLVVINSDTLKYRERHWYYGLADDIEIKDLKLNNLALENPDCLFKDYQIIILE